MKNNVNAQNYFEPQNRIIRIPELLIILGISRATLWRWRKNNGIPEAICMGPRVIGWPSSVIESWIESK